MVSPNWRILGAWMITSFSSVTFSFTRNSTKFTLLFTVLDWLSMVIARTETVTESGIDARLSVKVPSAAVIVYERMLVDPLGCRVTVAASTGLRVAASKTRPEIWDCPHVTPSESVYRKSINVVFLFIFQ